MRAFQEEEESCSQIQWTLAIANFAKIMSTVITIVFLLADFYLRKERSSLAITKNRYTNAVVPDRSTSLLRDPTAVVEVFSEALFRSISPDAW